MEEAGGFPAQEADREPENWLHRNNSHEVYAAMADHLGIKLTHENKRKMTKIIREALIADYEDNPDECYEWIVQLGLKVDELDIFEYQPWLHRVAQPLEALPSPPPSPTSDVTSTCYKVGRIASRGAGS
ncbi:hypothetical protein N9O24_00570 [bacterium]|nr:hypothetical protein [bacterium]